MSEKILSTHPRIQVLELKRTLCHLLVYIVQCPLFVMALDLPLGSYVKRLDGVLSVTTEDEVQNLKMDKMSLTRPSIRRS